MTISVGQSIAIIAVCAACASAPPILPAPMNPASYMLGSSLPHPPEGDAVLWVPVQKTRRKRKCPPSGKADKQSRMAPPMRGGTSLLYASGRRFASEMFAKCKIL